MACLQIHLHKIDLTCDLSNSLSPKYMQLHAANKLLLCGSCECRLLFLKSSLNYVSLHGYNYCPQSAFSVTNPKEYDRIDFLSKIN